ncbi:hypothetical protein V1517DRAFT_336251 [Lipomyces orientalis]|uniref:Uncharacterized protein n=1 Tax=Lipomyces orientalis TaxID=1233043 RepID=A0ACC3TVB7_9ASCO
MGSKVLMFGAGPTGLVLAQLLRQNGGCYVIVAAPEGLKMDLTKSLNAADEYIEISRKEASTSMQLEGLQKDNPYGFDIVVETTGRAKILENSINFVRRGGKLVVYGVLRGSPLAVSIQKGRLLALANIRVENAQHRA